MAFAGSLASTFVTTCLSATLWAAGCSNPKLSRIKSSGEIAPEALPSITDPSYGPWRAGCLEEGRRAHGSSFSLVAVKRPSYDLSRLALRNEGFRFTPDVSDLKAGRLIGRIVITNPNDATLEAMDDFTSDWNKDPASGGGLGWKKDKGTPNVWRSGRMVFQVEREDGDIEFEMKALDDAAPYEKLHPKRSDAHRRDRLFSFRELETVADSFVSSPSGLVKWFLPSYSGLAVLEAEMVETYREDGSLAGCLSVGRD